MHAFFTERVSVPGGTLDKVINDVICDSILCCSSGSSLRSVVFGRPGDHTRNYLIDGPQHAVLSLHRRGHQMVLSDSGGVSSCWNHADGFWFLKHSFNRNGTDATCIRLSPDGSRICAVYEDGGVCLSTTSFENRLILTLSVSLMHCEWSPDASMVLVGSGGASHQVLAFTSEGAYLKKLSLQCPRDTQDPISVIQWHRLGLLIAFASGRSQIMRGIGDENPVLIDCGKRILAAEWQPGGDLIALISEDSILFFSITGEHLRSLSSAEASFASIAWLSDCKLVVAAGASLLSATVVQTLPTCITSGAVFWVAAGSLNHLLRDTHTAEAIHMEHTVIAVRCRPGNESCCVLIQIGDAFEAVVLNASGSAVKRRRLIETLKYTGFDFCDNKVALSCSTSAVVWNTVADEVVWISSSSPMVVTSEIPPTQKTDDDIVGISVSSKRLAIARQSGLVHIYSVLDACMRFEKSALIGTRPDRLELNSDSTSLAVVDIQNNLFVVNLESSEVTKTTRKDCWDVVWATDASDLLACADRNKVYVLRGGKPEEPIHMSHRRLLAVTDLEVVTLDTDCWELTKFPSKRLRDLNTLIQTVGDLDDAFRYISRSPHERLWRVLATVCLDQTEIRIDLASQCFKELADAQGIAMCKRLSATSDPARRTMELALWFGRTPEAEATLRAEGRTDLVNEMKRLVGELDGVTDIDPIELGEFFFETGQFEKCIEQYMRCDHFSERLMEALLIEGRVKDLGYMGKQLRKDDPLLPEIGRTLGLAGLVEEARDAYIRCGQMESARSVSETHGRWDLVTDIERRFGLKRSHENNIEQLVKGTKWQEALDVIRHGSQLAQTHQVLERAFGDKSLDLVDRKQAAVLLGLESATGTELKLLKVIGGRDPWRPASVIHLYSRGCWKMARGEFMDALACSARLASFEADFGLVGEEKVYKLLALSSLFAGDIDACSKAFFFLERIDIRYRPLAFKIFGNPGQSTNSGNGTCTHCDYDRVPLFATNCDSCGRQFEYCVASGRPVLKGDVTKRCTSCYHCIILSGAKLVTCPLCHQGLS